MSDRICSVTGCGRVSRAKGWCAKHYYALRERYCSIRGCRGQLRSKGMCTAHQREFSELARRCPECDQMFTGHSRRKYCSVFCKAQAGRSPVRKAIEAGDPAALIVAVRQCSVEGDSGCWEWMFAKNPQGYGVVGQGGRGGLVHRHVVEAYHSMKLGLLTVHHKCANRGCVNPEHLQPISSRENVAEMFERNYYLRKIAELEKEIATMKTFNAAGQYTVTTVTESSSST